MRKKKSSLQIEGNTTYERPKHKCMNYTMDVLQAPGLSDVHRCRFGDENNIEANVEYSYTFATTLHSLVMAIGYCQISCGRCIVQPWAFFWF